MERKERQSRTIQGGYRASLPPDLKPLGPGQQREFADDGTDVPPATKVAAPAIRSFYCMRSQATFHTLAWF